jgi:isopenicillin N synthase-like dioxygenase
MPNLETSCLRILEYPPGAGSERHTDMDLFTLLAYRDPFDGLHIENHFGDRIIGMGEAGLHHGELLEEGGFGVATPHQVAARDEWQYSAVYFVLPSHETLFTVSGEVQSVGQWLAERYARSRTYK